MIAELFGDAPSLTRRIVIGRRLRGYGPLMDKRKYCVGNQGAERQNENAASITASENGQAGLATRSL